MFNPKQLQVTIKHTVQVQHIIKVQVQEVHPEATGLRLPVQAPTEAVHLLRIVVAVSGAVEVQAQVQAQVVVELAEAADLPEVPEVVAHAQVVLHQGADNLKLSLHFY